MKLSDVLLLCLQLVCMYQSWQMWMRVNRMRSARETGRMNSRQVVISWVSELALTLCSILHPYNHRNTRLSEILSIFYLHIIYILSINYLWHMIYYLKYNVHSVQFIPIFACQAIGLYRIELLFWVTETFGHHLEQQGWRCGGAGSG